MDELAKWLITLKIAIQEIHQSLAELEEMNKAMDEKLRQEIGIKAKAEKEDDLTIGLPPDRPFLMPPNDYCPLSSPPSSLFTLSSNSSIRPRKPLSPNSAIGSFSKALSVPFSDLTKCNPALR